MKFFAPDGWLTPKGDLVITFTGWLLMLGPWFLPIPFWLTYTLFCIGLVLGAYIGYEGQAKQAGYPPPFKKDPLGWRKAKESYAPGPDDKKTPIDAKPPNPKVKSCNTTI